MFPPTDRSDQDSDSIRSSHQPSDGNNSSPDRPHGYHDDEDEDSSYHHDDNEDEDYDLLDSTSLLTAYNTYPQEPDYYTLLNLARQPPPTDAQIRSAYRTLSLSFHPDKQPAHLAEPAKQHLERIREAYETLIDDRKRVVYDLLGRDGVRAEFGLGSAASAGVGGAGAAGQRGGSAEWRVGVKAKSPEEFRRWFVERMKLKERRAVNSLVEGRGSITLGVDASNTFAVDQEEGLLFINVPEPRLSKFGVAFSFKAPLPTWRNVMGVDEDEEDGNEVDDDDDDEAQTNAAHRHDVASLGDGPQMVINAGLSGKIRHMTQKLEVQWEGQEGSQVEEAPVPLVISTKELSLGVGVSHAFGDLSASKGILGKPALSFLQYSGLSANASVLPFPALGVRWAKGFALVPGTRPFRLELSTDFQRPIWHAPPVLGAYLAKEIGDQKQVFVNWTSGTLLWPLGFRKFLSPEYDIRDDFKYILTIPGELSQFQFGIVSQPASKYLASIDDDDDDDDEEEDVEFDTVRSKHRKNRSAAESWQLGVAVSPQAGALSFNYSRNIFSGKPSTDTSLSQWSSEGYHRLPQENEPRAVRFGVQSTVSFDMSLGWHLEGTRRVGDLTRMGLGIGVQSGNGLVMTVLWSRLGQNIRLPITLCPFEAATADAAAVAVLLPWAAYCALEFGFIRPRERRNHRRVIARRQRQLKKLVPKKREESQQAIQLMKDQVQRRRDREASQDGLVITRAEYGHYPKKKRSDGSERESEVADVTIPVMALVDNGQLVISKDTAKFHILGFYDPAPLLPKTLKIWYTYHGKEHYVEATDKEGVACPMRSHML
ncbi:J domain-containing protein [Aspergillus saccharolyticus JOP 1030-1]|uniref:Molecular chaperone n=1 Tax=Aspergillus saccharolyticus JOP 1030-1 TaxID=1450539 RepID=A0A318ZPC9_9EURO|nr:molecular chaperone [Aspergillus saccharolyticus JOP 1030-1]PYH45770.1 molecular chaperone [Aspergillus saccharolyticus JOP 1030-1]